VKMSIPQHRERRELPRGGSGIRRNAKAWLENLVGEFAGTLTVANFCTRCRELRVVARDGIFRSRTSTSRRTPAYIGSTVQGREKTRYF
jgi:hypothetical protein